MKIQNLPMKRIVLTGILLTTSLLSFAQLLTEPIATATDTARGILYQLPKTVLKIEVDTRCIQETPGTYYQYAERFLGLKDLIQTESIRYEITGFRVSTYSVPDQSQTYLISTGKKGKGISFTLSPEGFLRSINGKKEAVVAPEVSNISPIPVETAPKSWETGESSIITREMQQSISTAKMAELAANQLLTIRDTRFNMLTQELEKTPSDGRSYEIVLSELNRMENAYMDLFRGKQTESTRTFSYTITPEKDTTDVLLRFSLMKGVLDKNNLGGNPIFLELKKLPLAADSMRVDNSKAPKGLYYRIPAKAELKITDGKDALLTREITLPQFGRIMTLPASQIGSVELCPMTGNIVQLSN
jgi:hypothetical protein